MSKQKLPEALKKFQFTKGQQKPPKGAKRKPGKTSY
jgi:hypothetical protein